ncbi:acyl carrier protein 4, chloroplastic [Mercurialis annua]|uniref:acyl carrier protein 4, chloroplastic n=1 Tax=Mercurialis annua TaxID=3986 RepID=UPI00215E059D|nr:acyl carrier protein 4, chloroplastic [Mercurialis annua]
MASVSASCLRFQPAVLLRSNNTSLRTNLNVVSMNLANKGFPSLKASRFRISCAAKAETVEKVCGIVTKQLALAPEIKLTPESKFSELGADSLDTVEILMAFEEEFEISVEEDSAQNITTVQEAADLIEKLVQTKTEAAA